jgi:hypothetical protein
MLLVSSLLASALALAPAAPDTGRRAPAAAAEPSVSVTIDSSKHEVVIVAGPYDLPNMPKMETDGMMMMDHGMEHDEQVHRFTWPVDGWFRGFAWSVTDAKGNPVERRVMHHMIMVNFDRRQITYRAAERLLGAGSETDDATVPKTIGVPMNRDMHLGMYIAWHNDTGAELKGVYLKLRMFWMPTNQNPRPVNALPIYMDVNLTVGGSNTFDIPPGHSTKSWEFTLPISGKILGVGGHLHDYGSSVRLEDAETGKVMARVVATRTPDGKVVKVSRKLFGVTGDGLSMKANHKYRVVGEYDNPTQTTYVKGAMAHMVGLFTPDDMSKWPQIDPSDPVFQRDLASLAPGGDSKDGGDRAKMDHMNMEHGNH